MSPKPAILVVDDHPAVSTSLGFILEDAGYNPLVATSARQAVELTSEFLPDIALIDIHLPDQDGISLARQLCQRVPDCKILLMTGSTEGSELVQTAMKEGLEFEVLAKPIPPPELLQRLSSMLPSRTKMPTS